MWTRMTLLFTGIVTDWWDPCSLRQTRNLSALLVHLVDTYPTLTANSKTTTALLTAVSQKIKAAVDDDLFMPVYQKEAIENSATGAKAFLDRQFWVAIKVIKCFLSLEGFLSTAAVQEQVVDGVINRNIVLGLQCSSFGEQSTVVKCRAVFNALPAKWLKSNDLSKQLESLCKVVERIADHQRKSGSRDAAKELMKIVEKIRNK
uniref:Uncharacterized protein n=1 Tax=Plectus sambesii TaxID=2011161 RepID=A0A914UW47_9BILA